MDYIRDCIPLRDAIPLTCEYPQGRSLDEEQGSLAFFRKKLP
jgi:hypothetical protein